MMRIDILTLFPDTVNAVLHESILGRAGQKGILDINCVQIRDYTQNRQCQVDDYPYGGGFGCVIMAQPLKSCLDAVVEDAGDRKRRVIYMSPQGKTFNQRTARRLATDYDHLVLVCGHYEGIDERFIEACVDEEISLGDFVMTGGEIAAMAIADSVCRLIPGVLSDPQCYIGESHWDGLLEYPQYTRPEEWEGKKVPEVLLQGDHARVEHWRRKQQFLRTMQKRPDLYGKLDIISDEDKKILAEIKKESGRKVLSEPISLRLAEETELSLVMQIIEQGREYLKKHHTPQWQGTVPDERSIQTMFQKQECYLMCYKGAPIGVLCMTDASKKCYDDISDGKWTEGVKACTLQYLALEGSFLGCGASKEAIRLGERLAFEKGYRAMRADIHKKNKGAKNLLVNAGFRYRGNISDTEDGKPGTDLSRQCFEKILKGKENR